MAAEPCRPLDGPRRKAWRLVEVINAQAGKLLRQMTRTAGLRAELAAGGHDHAAKLIGGLLDEQLEYAEQFRRHITSLVELADEIDGDTVVAEP